MQQSTIIVRHPATDVVITGVERSGSITVETVTVGSAATAVLRRPGAVCTGSSGGFDAIARRIRTYLDGMQTDLSEIPVAYDGKTAFQRRVLETARGIPYGVTWSYRTLAAEAGVPTAVRAVASVLRKNSIALLIPCHRVIRSDGTVGGYCGSRSGEDVRLKQFLLNIEAENRLKRY